MTTICTLNLILSQGNILNARMFEESSIMRDLRESREMFARIEERQSALQDLLGSREMFAQIGNSHAVAVAARLFRKADRTDLLNLNRRSFPGK